jgi:hypothetical protein
MPDPSALQTPLTCILPIRSPEGFRALVALLPNAKPKIDEALMKIGTVHFARFVFLQNDTQLAIITTFDGPFERYISDFAFHLGPIFDALFEHIENPPPAPVARNTREFVDWVRAHDARDIGFFSAYPRLSVLDIRAHAAAAEETTGEQG